MVYIACRIFFLCLEEVLIPASSQVASYRHIPGLRDATQRAKPLVVAGAVPCSGGLFAIGGWLGRRHMCSRSTTGGGVAAVMDCVLKKAGTARNWNSVATLLQMAEQIQS